jgi:hypothetical protein
MQAINRHSPQDQFHLAKEETPARRRLASRITSCPRILLVKSSWAFRSLDITFAQDKRLGPPSVARQASAPHNAAVSLLHVAAHKCIAYQAPIRQQKTAGMAGQVRRDLPRLGQLIALFGLTIFSLGAIGLTDVRELVPALFKLGALKLLRLGASPRNYRNRRNVDPRQQGRSTNRRSG